MDDRDKDALQRSAAMAPNFESQRNFWRDEALCYQRLFQEELAKSKSWKNWSVWWLGWALFSLGAFWF